jgi:hypothetical protein
MRRRTILIVFSLVILVGLFAVVRGWSSDGGTPGTLWTEWTTVNRWQRLTAPGELSAAHASLEQRCDACHASGAGVPAVKCIVCHANSESILQRQPTAFHADIASCHECHREHQGRHQRPTAMDHGVLANIGLRQLEQNPDDEAEERLIAAQLRRWIGSRPAHQLQPELSHYEAVLDCAACHKSDDRHFDLFGTDCAQCHATTAWTIPDFQHPPTTSMDCAQCHQAPPSHYMMHFSMVSQRVAGKHNARVDQCFICHQTTAWPDIKDVGWYKHH